MNGEYNMRILICDDDLLIVEKLQISEKLFQSSAPEMSGDRLLFRRGVPACGSGRQGYPFLDIEMPGLDGIYVGNELKKKDKDIIIFIITSYSEYLDEAMRFHVFRYLSKPIDRQRLFRNLKDALDLYHSRLVKVPIETRQGVHVLPVSSIIMVEAQGKKVIVHTTTQDFETIHTMPYWLELLPSNRFFQTHRSFIVNYEHITDFDRMLVHLANGQFDAYLTKRKYSAFKEAYLLYLESTR